MKKTLAIIWSSQPPMEKRPLKTSNAGLAALLAVVAIAASGAGHAQTTRHNTPEGRACLYFVGYRYDEASEYHYARWANRCDTRYTVEYERVDPNSGERITRTIGIPAIGTGEALLLLSDSVSWNELM
jgi:hypothetical protein